MNHSPPELLHAKQEVRASNGFQPLHLFAFCLLTLLLMLFEFGGALGSYFTSDDLIHITYAHRMLSNNCELFLRTFSTVWMQDTSTEIFYRPLVEVSFAIDQLFSGANPFGYHLANLLYSFAGALALLSIANSLARRFEVAAGAAIGYASALLFAVNPLHPEVTTWLIGRVDGLSTLFYLLSFALFLKLPQGKNAALHPLGWLSLFSFSFALMCKEMAASLPLVVFSCCVFSPGEEAGKWRRGLLLSAPYLGVLALYFLVRFLATGEFLGGYVGAVGDANSFSMSKFCDRLMHVWKIAFPFNEEVIERKGLFEAAFRAVYVLFGLYLVARLRFDRFSCNQLKLLGFLSCWLGLQFLPLYQVFMLHNSLAGARLFYLSTAVIAALAAVALVPTTQWRKSNGLKRSVCALAALIFCCLTALFVTVGRINNQSWIVAAQHVEELQAQLNSVVASLPERKKLLLAYTPIQVLGAHMFNRYYLIQSLLSEPLLKPGIWSRVSVLEPRFYTYDHLIPSGLLRKKLADSANYQCMYWDVSEWKLKDLAQASGFDSPSKLNERLPELSVKQGKLLGTTDLIAERPFPTRAVKFVDVDLQNSNPKATSEKSALVLAFDSRLKQPRGIDNWSQAEFDASLPLQTVRFPVDEKLSWFLNKDMSEFSIYLGEKTDFKILAARLNDGKTLIPSLSQPAVQESNDGVFRVEKFPVQFKYDVSNIPGAVACYCELSRPRAMFQLDSFTYRDVRPAKRPLKTWSQDGTMGSISIERTMFPEDACYQLRVFAKRADGSITGTSSDQINLGVNDRPPGQQL